LEVFVAAGAVEDSDAALVRAGFERIGLAYEIA
jgi:hypothetical protein